MRAAWWWIDRWQKSTAYKDMTLAEQGAYRNLLDELWLRDGLLPKSERVLAKISGGPFEWKDVRKAVMARFVETADGFRNETHDRVMAESKYRAEKQKRYRDKKGNVTDNVTESVTVTAAPSPSPSPSKDKDPTPRTETDLSPSGKPKDDDRAIIRRIFDFWKRLFALDGRVKLTATRKGKIRARLRDSGLEEIETCLRGWASDPWRHEGFDRHDLATLLTSREKLEKGIAKGGEMKRAPPPGKAQQKQDRAIDSIRKAREADDAYERSLRSGDGGVSGGSRGRHDPGEGPHLLGYLEDGPDGRADDPRR